eukprot:scaffold35024_cov43-Phaeocystis_antarctica.AAC.1
MLWILGERPDNIFEFAWSATGYYGSCRVVRSQKVRDPQRWHVVFQSSGARSLAVSATPRCSIGAVSIPSYSQSPTVDVDRRLSLSQQPSARR